MPQAYIIARRAIWYRRYITRSDRNGYHWKKSPLSVDKSDFFLGAAGGIRTHVDCSKLISRNIWLQPKTDKAILTHLKWARIALSLIFWRNVPVYSCEIHPRRVPFWHHKLNSSTVYLVSNYFYLVYSNHSDFFSIFLRPLNLDFLFFKSVTARI